MIGDDAGLARRPTRTPGDPTVDTPDLTDLALMLAPAVRGDGLSLPVGTVVREYQAELEALAAHLAAGAVPPDFTLFVPDLWHVAKGSARGLPRGDGDRLFAAQRLGLEAGARHLDRDPAPFASRHGYPGALFRARPQPA